IHLVTNTLHLRFIHHFGVTSGLAVCAEALAWLGVTMRWRRVTMTSKTDQGRSNALRALLLLLASTLMPQSAFAAESLGIELDQATIMKLPEKVSTIVVGNPLIADVAVQSGGLVVVTGKGYGSTNLIVLDRSGAVRLERSIV